ncbi:hypothetical protein FRX31_033664 [Thalictrum thalictroides]|uniref:Uncharacterized protein n=1 Tax=Thalictrum thalictroides TaxID=46969 RepID=A0A7J6UW21_THATH|nr:hypothetical protein FRX31_033664 [Thalictrum thalictroides]
MPHSFPISLDPASVEKSNHVIISKGEGNKQQPLQILDVPPGNGKQPLHILNIPDRSLEVVVLETPPDVYENVYGPKHLASKQTISSTNGTTFEMQAILFDMCKNDDFWVGFTQEIEEYTKLQKEKEVGALGEDEPEDDEDELNEEIANDSMPMLGLPQIYGRNFYEDDTQELSTHEVNGQDIENEELEDSALGVNSQSSFRGTPSKVLGLEDIMSDLGDIRCNLEDRFRYFDEHVRNATHQQRQSTPSQANNTQHHHQGIPTQENVVPQ